MLARLENDQEVYRNKLAQLQVEFQQQKAENSLITEIFERKARLESSIDEQIT